MVILQNPCRPIDIVAALEDIMANLNQVKTKIEGELNQLKKGDQRTSLKEKLMAELTALEAKYDDQIQKQRDEINAAALGEGGSEGEAKVNAVQSQVNDATRLKQELDKKVTNYFVIF